MQIILVIGLLILVVWLVVKKVNIENEEKTRQISGELRVKYPNFVKAIRTAYQTNASLYADNNKALCYKIPISTYGKQMGEMFYSIIDTSNVGNKPYIIQVYKGFSGVEINTERNYMVDDNDLEIEDYLELFNELAKEIMSDERYLRSVSRLN